MLLLVPFTFAADGDYKLPEVTKHVEVKDDGSCDITEEIVYDIEGTVNGTYRDINIDGYNNQSVSNLSVETPGYYNRIEILDSNDKIVDSNSRFNESIRIKVWLYNDKERTQKINNQKVPVIFKYTFNKGVVIYNDVADFQYLAWDKQWKSDVDTFRMYVKIPGSSNQAEFWNTPSTNVKSSTWNNNELETVATNLPKNKTFTQRILMPTDYFKSTINARVDNSNQRANIEKYQNELTDKENTRNFIFELFEGVLALLIAIPAGIYAFFGREPKIDYDAEYEYDLPTDAKALEVQALFNGDVGSVYKKAFSTQILDLIDRKYYKIIHSDEDKSIIKRTNKSTDDLVDYEIYAVDYLNKFADSEGYISLKSISEKETPKEYKKFIKEWKKKVTKSIPESLKERYFDSKGSKLFNYFLLIVFVASLITFLYSINNELVPGPVGLGALLLMPISFLLYCIPNTFAGRWTPEGKEVNDKWQNFKKYISDYSLINERPPESVQVWGKYLVYASALGCADKATNTMKEYYDVAEISDDSIGGSDVAFFAYSGGMGSMDSSLSSLDVSAFDSDGGSGSSGGGGFGGGGGGTF